MELPKRKQIRLKYFNYAQNGYYFVTICTDGRKNLFAKITDNEIEYTEYGKIAISEMEKTKILRKENHIFIDNYIVMPNHIHIIVKILGNYVGTWRAMSDNSPKREFSKPISQSVSSVIGAYKSAVSKQIHIYENGHGTPCPYNKIWQPRFYDNIIRNEEKYQLIWTYINNNVLMWEKDKFYNI